jgi:protein SCO1/2
MDLKSFSFVGFVVAWLVTSCRENPTTGAFSPRSTTTTQQIYSVTGVVKEIKMDRRTAVIQHEEVPGYMPAMTMPLKAKNTNEINTLQPGDQISFRLVVTPDEGWIEQVRKLGGAPVNTLPAAGSFRRVREVDPLNVGDLMPDYSFTNELGEAVSLSGFKGKALALTFIFTRCPFPDFCPRMSSNFAEACKKLNEMPDSPGNWHLLSISFDPAFDTPAMLRALAKRYHYDPKRWSFVTGAMIDIDAITEQFGLGFTREGQSFNHNLRTVVIDARGRVQKILVGNEWKSDELVAELVIAAKAKAEGR